LEYEAICAETGGSCMDLVTRERTAESEWTIRKVHVTDRDVIARAETFVIRDGNFTTINEADLSKMFTITRDLLSESLPPFKPYQLELLL
jgi:hypothetical protein